MKLLLIGDVRDITQVLHKNLTDQNYIVDIAHNNQQGWELLGAFDYDLLVLSSISPQNDDINLCRRIRSHGYTMPIMLLKQNDNAQERATALDAGADDCVVKPYELPELLARIRALLRRGDSLIPSTINCAELCLDTSSYQIASQENFLALTPQERNFLKLFLQRGCQIFSQSFRLEYLWSLDISAEEKSFNYHIRYLRKKLNKTEIYGYLLENFSNVVYHFNRNSSLN